MIIKKTVDIPKMSMNIFSHSSKHDRNVSCRIEPISRSVIATTLAPATKYLFMVIIGVFAITSRCKPSIERIFDKQKVRSQLIEIKKDYKVLGDAKSRLEHLSRNFDHIDRCFPVHGTSRVENYHIRRVLKRFLHYESSGRIITPADDPINHESCMKFVAFLVDTNHEFSNQESCMQCRKQLNVQIKSFKSRFPESIPEKRPT